MVVGMNTAGTRLNQMLDRLGYPDMVGDLAGARMDLMTGNMGGFMRNMSDAYSGLSTNQLNSVMGKLPKPFGVGRPIRRGLARSRVLHTNTYSNGNGNGATTVERRDLRFGRSGRAARSLESAIQRNPSFRAGMERRLGGRIILDGRADGRITVVKHQANFKPAHLGFGLNAGMNAMNPLAGSLFGGLARMDQELGQLMSQAGQGAGQANGAQSLNSSLGLGPNATIEDKIAAFMFKEMEKSNKELEDLIKQSESGGKGGKSGKSGGFFGALKSIGKNIFSGAAKIGGGVLGGMIGGPFGAKLGSMFGGAVGDQITGGGKSAQGGSASGKSKSSAALQQKITLAIQKRQQMFTMLSNMLKVMHDTSMTAIRNIR
jgi:hypothetical protein